MKYDWTIAGYDAARNQGVTPEEVHHVLVWLREETDDYWLVVIAFAAGIAGQRLYRRIFQE